MIQFLRKIRLKLLSDGKTGQYLKYAIGEIFLVVIGILIAIQLNTLNQNRQNEKKILSHLEEISANLQSEITTGNSVVEFFEKRDSLLRLVILDQITREDFSCNGPHCPQYAITVWTYVTVNRNAYNNLILMSGNIPEHLRSLYQELNILYEVTGENLAIRKSKLENKMSIFSDYLRENKVWYYKFQLGKTEEEAITYFLEDPLYKNHVAEYFDDARKLKKATSNYLNQAMAVDSLINEVIRE